MVGNLMLGGGRRIGSPGGGSRGWSLMIRIRFRIGLRRLMLRWLMRLRYLTSCIKGMKVRFKLLRRRRIKLLLPIVNLLIGSWKLITKLQLSKPQSGKIRSSLILLNWDLQWVIQFWAQEQELEELQNWAESQR